MIPPIRGISRRPTTDDLHSLQIIEKEKYLRQQAYKNTLLNTGPEFFDDSDMTSSYKLVVVYERLTGTPLLSARYFYNKPLIGNQMAGENNEVDHLSHKGKKFSIEEYKEDQIFLADRLSGNIKNQIYRENRTEIFSLLYSKIYNENKTSSLVLMVRKQGKDKQLNRYINLGFDILGSIKHKGKSHEILIADFNRIK